MLVQVGELAIRVLLSRPVISPQEISQPITSPLSQRENFAAGEFCHVESLMHKTFAEWKFCRAEFSQRGTFVARNFTSGKFRPVQILTRGNFVSHNYSRHLYIQPTQLLAVSLKNYYTSGYFQYTKKGKKVLCLFNELFQIELECSGFCI